DAEGDNHEKRAAKAGRAGGSGGDRERQHRDGVDDAERDDGERDRLEAEPDATQPAQRSDLDQIVEPEREHDAAGSRRPNRGQTAGLAGALVEREQAAPAAGTRHEADEVAEAGGGEEP